MLNQTYGPKVFVGREKEIAAFEQMLDSPVASQWILNVYGPGGIGKTQLLHRFVGIAEERKVKENSLLVTKELIDLYWTENQRTFGLLKNIADQLGPELFASFYAQLDKYDGLLGQQIASEKDQLKEQEARTESAFFEIYKNLPVKRIVLFFDTTELATEVALDLWQSLSLLSDEAKRKTLLVLSGRKRLDDFPEKNCKWLPVIGLTPEQVELYFKNVSISLAPLVVEKVAELSQGRPILIALTVDWLRLGRFPDSLMGYTPQQFEQAMVERVQQLQFPEDQLILAMAHFWRRFDDELLTYVMEHIFSGSHVNIESLAKYSFVKYRPKMGAKSIACTLHDEMRDLVVKYVLNVLDPRKEERREWNKQILSYYAEKVDQEEDQSERQDLCLERLFYMFDVDIHQAFGYSRQLVDDALYRFDFQHINRINDEFLGKEKLLNSIEINELTIRKATILHQRDGETTEAKQKIETLPDNLFGISNQLLVWLMEFYTDSGDPEKAIDLNVKYDLENELQKKINESVGEKRKSFEFLLGILYNNLGYTARNQGHINNAVIYYEKAQEHFKAANGAYAYLARTRNNLGFVFHKLGRDEEALAHCETALKVRQYLQNSYEIGLSYNVMGQIYTDLRRVEEAVSSFDKAISAFEQAGNERGKALAYTSYGRLMRQWGWYKEDFAKEDFNPEREEYKKAATLFDNAIKVFKEKSDLSNLCEALNEKGTLLRQQKRWKDALEYYNESILWAENIGNTYRTSDNLQDIGILYEFWGNEEKKHKSEYILLAIEYAQKASDLAWKNNDFYLYARAQRTLGEAFFNLKEYKKAFVSAANACIYVLRRDPMGKAKWSLVYDKFKEWTVELLLHLPSIELAEQMGQYLIMRWKEEEQNEKRLFDKYPDFVLEVKSTIDTFPLLAKPK